MDKKTLIGLVLIGVVLIGYGWWQNDRMQTWRAEHPEEVAKAQQAQEQAANANQAKGTNTSKPQPVVTDTTALFYAATQGKAEDVVLKNEKVTVTLSTKGGMVSEVKLNEYKSYNDFVNKTDKSLLLYNANDASLDILLEAKNENIDFSQYFFTPVNATDSTVTMRLTSPQGATIDLDYHLLPNNYLVNFSIKAEGMKNLLPARADALQMRWHDRVAQHEKGFYFENQYSTLTYKLSGDDTEKLSEQKSEKESAAGTVDWIAFKNQYFSSVLIAAEPLKNVDLESEQLEENSGYLKAYTANMQASFDPTGSKATQFQFYFGPNNYRLLQSMDRYKVSSTDNDLEGLVYLGWPVVRWVNRFFTIYVFDFFTKLGLPMGIVLLLITLLLRVIVYAPTRKTYLNSARMRLLKPKVDEIAAKYPKQEDAMKRQAETTQLYSMYGLSPMGGCLPTLIQMPIWIAMFNFVPNAIEMRQQSFLWAEDLSAYDSILSWDTPIWGIGNHLSLWCLLFCAANLVYSMMTMRQQRDTMSSEQAQQMKMMQWMMLAMPLMFFFMFNKYSAGLNYYYFLSLLLSALTMWYLRKTTDDARLLARLEENYKANLNNPNKKPSGLAARLEALQKQQEEMMKARGMQR